MPLAALPDACRGGGNAPAGARTRRPPSGSRLSGDPAVHRSGAHPQTPTDSHMRQEHSTGGDASHHSEDQYGTPVAQQREAQLQQRQGPRGQPEQQEVGGLMRGQGKGSAGGASLGAFTCTEEAEEEDEMLGKGFGSDDEEGSMSGEDGDGFHLDESTFKWDPVCARLLLEKKRWRHQLR